MGKKRRDYQLACMAGAYGPKGRIPLLEDLLGGSLTYMITLGYASWEEGYTSGIFQNDGKIFPQDSKKSFQQDHPTDVRHEYCREIRRTAEGLKRCLACDCQGIRLTGGTHSRLSGETRSTMKEFPIQLITEYAEDKVYCYMCHAGLVELIRDISLHFGDAPGVELPIGAIWAGQHKVTDRAFSSARIHQLAEEIGYENPNDLVRLYESIKSVVDMQTIDRRARALADIARSISDSALLSFRQAKKVRFDQVNQELLSILREPLPSIEVSSPGALEDAMSEGLSKALKKLAAEIPNCNSVVCEVPADWQQTNEAEIKIVAYGIRKGGYPSLENFFHAKQSHLQEVFKEFKGSSELRPISPEMFSCKFFSKLQHSLDLDDFSHALIRCIEPVRGGDAILLWVIFIGRTCELLLKGAHFYPGGIEMLRNISESIYQITNVSRLLVQNKRQLNDLTERQRQLQNGKKQMNLLVYNMGHQVSRPIAELKYASYILSNRAFSKLAYSRFRASLVEVERGARNFANYEKLTTAGEKRHAGVISVKSFDILENLYKAKKRINPLLESRFMRLNIRTSTRSLPHLTGDEDAFLESLVNVLHNAIKYSVGPRPIELDANYEKRSRLVEIRVTNYGIELPKEDWERIFEAATRSETARQVAIEGTGIGLYITRESLKLFDGTIKVECSEPFGKTKDGETLWRTTFLITLNLRRR